MNTNIREARIDMLRRYEVDIFRIAIYLLQKEALAISVTKHVLQQIWQDAEFDKLCEEQRQQKIIRLVGKASICQLTA